MMRNLLLAAAFAVCSCRAADCSMAECVSAKVLPFEGMAASSSGYAMRALEELDQACDDKWRTLKTRSEYDEHRLSLRDGMMKAIGTMPARTPLNAKTVASVKREGYTIEKIVFESMPGLLVPANLFIPDGEGRHPAIVMSCGHSKEGKDYPAYLRACVIAVKRGFVALMFDPYDQGERRWSNQISSTTAHTQMGLRANLIDWSAPLLRIWDGMRAIDYVLSRAEVDPSRIGYMGQSGGGTMTALLETVDTRIRAAAPSCFLTSLRMLCHDCGPQDGEQNIFGQLAFGLNHTGYVLVPDIPVAVTCKFSDAFPFSGVRTLFQTVRDVERNIGIGPRAFLNAAPGPHSWTEATETASVMFLAQQFFPSAREDKIDLDALWALDLGHDITKAELGLSEKEVGCTPEYSTEKAGSRHIHDIIAERFAQVSSRKSLDLDAKRSAAVRLAKVKTPAEVACRVKETCSCTTGDVTASRIVVQYPKSGHMLPAVCLSKPHADKAPVLVVAYPDRKRGLSLAEPYLENGHPVMIADVSGVGEIGKEMHCFYGRKERPDEGLGAMCYLMGEPLVGRRATDMLVFSQVLASRHDGLRPILVASGPLAIAAAHAFAADSGAFSTVRVVDEPESWDSVLSSGSSSMTLLYYADIIPSAALYYDWKDLLPGDGA